MIRGENMVALKQTRTKAKMLAAFPLATAEDKRWCHRCPSLGSPAGLPRLNGPKMPN